MSLKLISKISSDDVAIENTVEEATKPSTYSHYQRRKSKLAKLLTVGKRSSSFEEDEESKHLSVKDHKRYISTNSELMDQFHFQEVQFPKFKISKCISNHV